MSHLADLIKELCPDGVEYRRLDELFATRNGYTPSRSDASAWDSHDIPWFRMEDIRENGGILDRALTYISSSAVKNGVLFPENSLLVATSATIGAHALITVPHLSNQRFTSLRLKDEYRKYFDYRFLYYYCFVLDAFCLEHVNVSSFPSVDMRAFRSFKFPVVPLAVQREIVRILDQFTTLEAELEAELEARRAQYEYYRNQLLSYDALASRGPVEWVKLGEVASKIITGVTPKAADPKYYQDATNPWIRTQDVNFCRINEASAFVTDQAVAELPLKWVSPHSVVVAISGASAGRSAILNIRAVTNQHCCNIEINSKLADFRYVYYCIASCYEQLRNLGRGARGDLNVSIIKSFEIPLPALYEQRYVADILDRFDALVNDISSGLPAEIAARRAQYEYYRDRLLSFPEKK